MDIIELKKQTQQKFDELSAQGEALRVQVEEVEDEKKRLQGEYRAYDALETQPDPATTIVAEPKVSKKAAK